MCDYLAHVGSVQRIYSALSTNYPSPSRRPRHIHILRECLLPRNLPGLDPRETSAELLGPLPRLSNIFRVAYQKTEAELPGGGLFFWTSTYQCLFLHYTEASTPALTKATVNFCIE